ncbi:PAQR family membrane homeostasis protein TrhA [Vallitalea okinawensis]|uniref:PAQR family membrane homeostasis protein TrhA n=1 Tax=Vallitalea okinawensis TaxID=2078660 RepID=UPI001478D135|nr:hemolysin III family protein [Vallitalea okinawensis]
MTRIKEPINALSHLLGVCLSCLGLILMIFQSYINNSLLQFIGSLIFGLSLIALYTASTVYHWIKGTDHVERFLRKLDHTMIYVLIAGTYTPICLITLNGPIGWGLLALVWGLALLGIVTKLLWLNAPRWLYTGFYVALGWVAVFFLMPLYDALPSEGFFWLLAGGILYTVGALIYATKPKWITLGSFGFHEIFHVFIILGSLSHFVLVSSYVLT